MIKIEHHHYVHLHGDGQDQIVAALKQLGVIIMATGKELADQLDAAVGALETAVQPLADAVNEMEAKVTEALKNAGVPQDVQDQIGAAIGKVQTLAGSITNAVSDARDGVDEATNTGGDTGGGGGVNSAEPA